MDKDRVIGSATHIKGAIKAAVGELVGDAKLKSDGHAEKVAGTIQNAVGSLKDTIRGIKSK